MTSTIVFVLLLGFVFVSLTLILGLGLASREEQRADEERVSREAVARDELGPGSSTPVRRGRSADDLVAQLEAFIRKEAAAVAAFVAAPSVGGLLGNRTSAPGEISNGDSAPDAS